MIVRKCVLLFYAVLVTSIVVVYLPNTNGLNLSITGGNENVAEDCQTLLEKFAANVGLFTFCAISHARPIKLCELCIDQYLDALSAHDEILELEDKTTKQSCKLELINLDRLEIIESTYKNVVDLWDRGKCNNCFRFDNGKITTDLSTTTKDFQKLNDANADCFAKYVNSTSEDVCKDCRDIYCKMNEFYNKIKEHEGDGDICIDIVDAMNSTRSTWSQTFGCTLNSLVLDLSFIITASAVAVVTIMFYIMAKMFSIKAQRKLLRQNRMGGQFPTTDPVAGTSGPSR